MNGSFKAFPQLEMADLSDSARWLRGVATATQVLVTQVDLERAIRTALGCVGQAAQVEVASVLQANGWSHSRLESSVPTAHQRDRSLTLAVQWSNDDETEPVSPSLASEGLSETIWHPLLLRWQKEWLAGRAIYGPAEHFPAEEKDLLLARGIQSFVALPIQVQLPSGKNAFWGVLGLEATQPLSWSLTEISTLCSVAACIGGAIARDAEQHRLRALNDSLQAQVEELQRQALAEVAETHHDKPIPVKSPPLEAPQTLTEALADQRRQAKQDFLSSLNQGLSEPLHGVLGQAQRLNRTFKLGAEEEQGLAMIHQHGSQLLQQISWMLDLDRLKSDGLKLHPELVHFPSFLQGVMEICREELEQAGLLLVYQPAFDLPQGVQVDAPRLQQVLMALLKSAIAGGQRGQITFAIHISAHRITPRPPADRIRFSVTRTAQNPDDVIATQSAFEQAGEMEGDLAIVVAQQLVSRMGGQLLPEPWLATSYHWGFEIELPVQADWYQQTLDKARAIGYEGPRQRILIVDDRWENRGALTSLLAPLGFELCEAMDGQDGLKRLQSFQPDLVITDLVMPVLDGFAMMAKIRAQAEWEELPILVSSASVGLRDQQRSLEQGGDDCLMKPVQLNELLGLLEKHLGIRWVYRDQAMMQ